MPEAISHHSLEPEIHVLVALDHQTRQARYLTRYDDGTEGETIHELYWHVGTVDDPGDEVRSRLVGNALAA